MPGATATLSVEVCEPDIEPWDSVGISSGSEDDAVSETVPENPRIDVRLIVEAPELPAIIVSGSGLADRAKSGPITRMSANAE